MRLKLGYNENDAFHRTGALIDKKVKINNEISLNNVKRALSYDSDEEVKESVPKWAFKPNER